MVRIPTRTGTALGALLTASLLLGAPSASQAKEGKWWTPRQSGGGGERHRAETRVRTSPSRGFARTSPSGGFARQWRSYGGQRIYRESFVVGGSYRSPRYRSWRTYAPPVYSYSRRVIRVRPVRFYIAAVFGGVAIRGSYDRHDDDCVYGCNFCDARFSDYGGYRGHIAVCSHRPHGYRVECNDWDSSVGSGYDDRDWQDCEDDDRGEYRDHREIRDHRDHGYKDGRDDRDRDDRDYRDGRDDRGHDRDDWNDRDDDEDDDR